MVYVSAVKLENTKTVVQPQRMIWVLVMYAFPGNSTPGIVSPVEIVSTPF